MKLQLIFLFLLILSIDAAGQNSFSTVYGGVEYDRPTCIKQIGSFYYFTNFEFSEEFLPDHRAEIIKLDDLGNIVDNTSLLSTGAQYVPLNKIFPIDNAEFLVLGGVRESEDSNTSIWIIKMDTSLNLFWEKRISTDVKYLERMSYAINSSGNLALIVTLSTGSPNYRMSILFLEITLNGDLVRSRFETTGNPVSTIGYSIISHGKGYYAFVEGFASYMPIPITSPAQRLDLDSNFNIQRVHTLPDGIGQYMTVAKINEESYYLTGTVYETGYYTEIGIQKTDTSNIVLASNHSGMPGNFPDYAAWLESMSFKDKNNIFTGGTGYAAGGLTQCNLLYPKVFILSNYDSLLNCRWTKYYGCDTACYYLMAMDATDDGGCVMAGTIVEPDHPTDIVIIKVDSLGLITSTNTPGTRSMQALVYPNPGNDYLMLQTGQQNIGAVFTIINIQGQKLIEISITKTTQQISTHTIPSGVYTWSLSRGNTLIETGKWVKQ